MCLALQLLAACDASTRTSVAPSTTTKCAIALSASATTFDIAGGEGHLTVTTERDCTWAATSGVPWISLPSNASGQGMATLRFVVAPNNEPVARSGALTVGDEQVTIAQRPRACSYELSTRDLAVPVSGGARDVDVRASSGACEWTARSAADWITIGAGAAGRGSGRVTFAASPSSGPPRTGSIQIAGQTVTVRQGDGCTYNVDPAVVSVPAAGGRTPVSVSTAAGCPWSASGGGEWVGIASAPNGTGASTVQISVSANTGPVRTATLTIAGRTVRVSQASGCSFTATPSTVTMFAPGGSATITVTSGAGCQWTAVSQAEWIAVTAGSSGSGNGVVSLLVARSRTPRRTGSVIVAGQTVSVTQANGCHYELSGSSRDIGAAGGPGGLRVTTENGCGWQTFVEGGDGWVFLTRGRGNGSGPMEFLVAPNLGPPRSARLLIENQPFTIRQAGR